MFWFNPILIFYKKAIQLNHEFLADEFVNHYYKIFHFINLYYYQNKRKPTIDLVSNLNFLVAKKRLLMMTKNTTQTIAITKTNGFNSCFRNTFLCHFRIRTVAMENQQSYRCK